MNEELQVENGHFTRIVNPLIEHLIAVPFRGCELAVAIHIIRKTYGFNKTQDEISLTQFEQALGRTRPTIVKALANLQLVNIAKLVKKGYSRKASNIWTINKYFTTWELVKVAKLVKTRRSTSKELNNQLVKTAIHTKDNLQKTTTKEIISKDITAKQKKQPNPDIDYLIQLMKAETGLDTIDGSQRSNRNYCWLAIKKFKGREGVAWIIKAMVRDKFHSNNFTSFKYLYNNAMKVILEAKQKKQNKIINIQDL